MAVPVHRCHHWVAGPGPLGRTAVQLEAARCRGPPRPQPAVTHSTGPLHTAGHSHSAGLDFNAELKLSLVIYEPARAGTRALTLSPRPPPWPPARPPAPPPQTASVVHSSSEPSERWWRSQGMLAPTYRREQCRPVDSLHTRLGVSAVSWSAVRAGGRRPAYFR